MVPVGEMDRSTMKTGSHLDTHAREVKLRQACPIFVSGRSMCLFESKTPWRMKHDLILHGLYLTFYSQEYSIEEHRLVNGLGSPDVHFCWEKVCHPDFASLGI
jgi:hypothetical protein